MKKILVVIDMQKDFTTGVLGNAECEAAIPAVISEIKNGDYDEVIFTMDTHTPDYMNTQEGKKLPVVHCVEGTEGYEIVESIMAAAKERFGDKITVYKKPTFGSTALGEDLRAKYNDGKDLEITFTGVCTGICVINNVSMAKAFCHEASVNVVEAACACVTPDTHRTAIEAMKTFHINII